MKKKTIWDMNRPSIEEFRRQAKTPVVLVLDNVRSLNNIGAMFRTCDAFGIERIVLCGISATPPSPEIHKTALGAEDSVAWAYCPTTSEAVERLHAEGYTVLCLEQVDGSVSLEDFDCIPGRHYALVCGNEVDGVDPAIVDMADTCIEIPQVGTKHSLNVSVSVGVALWHLFSRISLKAK